MNQTKQSSILRFLLKFSAVITFSIIFILIIYIFAKGFVHIKPELFALHYTSENASLFPALVNTAIVLVVSLLIAVPVGLGAAIYLSEYAKSGNLFVQIIRVTAETLSGIPSIVYGLFGLLFFVTALRWQFSLLAGCCTLAIMILPVIMRTSEEALLSVPQTYREASYGLGAGKLRTIFKIVLPSAIPGIINGIVLSCGRIIGETAALLYTAGTVAHIPKNIMGSGRTLAVHLYSLWCEGLRTEQAYATAVVLVLFVILLNFISGKIEKMMTKKQ